MKETDAIDEYILQHIDEESDYLKALYRDTHVKLLRPRMASGHLQGRMLKMFVRMIRPRQVLEIGTYSGYSALCCIPLRLMTNKRILLVRGWRARLTLTK